MRFVRPSDKTLRGWALAGLVVWVIVGAGLLAIGAARVLSIVAEACSAFLIAGLIVVLTRPFVRWLVGRGMRRGFAAAIGTLAALAVLVALVTFFAGPIITQMSDMAHSLESGAPATAQNVSAILDKVAALPPSIRAGLQNAAQAVGSALAEFAKSVAGFLFGSIGSILSLGFSAFMGLILTFWFLMDGPKIAGHMLNVVPARWRDDAREVARSFNASFSGYLIGTAINATVLFLICGIGFQLIGLPYGWFLASLIGVLDVIPFVGPIAAGLIAVGVGLTVSPMLALLAVIVVTVGEQFTDSFLSPIVMGKAVEIHPVAIIFSLAIGIALGGFLGAVLAIPTAAAIKTVYLYFRDVRPGQVAEPVGATGDPATATE